MYPAYTAAGARIHVASDVAHTVRSHSAPRLPPKEAVVTPPTSAAGTPAKKKLSTGGGGGGGHRVSQALRSRVPDFSSDGRDMRKRILGI